MVHYMLLIYGLFNNTDNNFFTSYLKKIEFKIFYRFRQTKLKDSRKKILRSFDRNPNNLTYLIVTITSSSYLINLLKFINNEEKSIHLKLVKVVLNFIFSLAHSFNYFSNFLLRIVLFNEGAVDLFLNSVK